MLAYLSIRKDVNSWVPLMEPIITATLVISAIASLVFLYLHALSLKYSSALAVSEARNRTKKHFYDLSIDLFFIIPVIFYFNFVYSQLIPLLNDDGDFSVKVSFLITVISVILLRPLWRVVTAILEGIYSFQSSKVSGKKLKSVLKDSDVKIVVFSALTTIVLPLGDDSFYAEPRTIAAIVIFITFALTISPPLRAGIAAGLKQVLTIFTEAIILSLEIYRNIGLAISSVFSSPLTMIRELVKSFSEISSQILKQLLKIISSVLKENERKKK